MKKNDPGTPSENTEHRRTEGLDSGNRTRHSFNKNAGGSKSFEKDKRKRITKIEKNPRPGFDADKENRSGERRSYNPNFTRDNKLRGEGDSRGSKESYGRYGRKEEGDKDTRGERRSYSPNFTRENDFRGSKESHGRYGRKEEGDKDTRGERRSYNPNFTRDNKSRSDSDFRGSKESHGRYGRKEEGEKDTRGERRSYNPNFTRDNKSRGEGDFQGSKKPYVKYGKKEEGEKDNRRDFRKKDDNYRDKKDYGGYRASKFSDRNRGESNRYVKKPRTFDRDRDDQGYTGGEYPKFPAPEFETPIRLNRYLAMSGVGSRRDADELIRSGQVTVNGIVITELGTKVMPADVVKFNENVIRGEHKVYIIMNKPKGYVTSLEDPHADKTVMDLLKNMVSERVYPVGRLDKNSVGILLITNDGDMTKRLTHPSFNKKKVYQVSLDKPLTKADMDQIATGITLEDGEIHADEISYVKDNKREIGVEIHSGRNRIVRRIFEHLGYKVIKLDRVYFAGLTKKNLRRGAWRFLTPQEVQVLQSGMYE